jgi:hypothetical protein
MNMQAAGNWPQRYDDSVQFLQARLSEKTARIEKMEAQMQAMQARMIQLTGQLLAPRLGPVPAAPAGFPVRALRGGDGAPR